MLKKKKAEDDEDHGAEATTDEERENEDANTTTASGKPSAFASLRKRATNAAKNALAKVGLAEEADEDPTDEEDDQDSTPQKARASRTLGEVFIFVRETRTIPADPLSASPAGAVRVWLAARRDKMFAEKRLIAPSKRWPSFGTRGKKRMRTK